MYASLQLQYASKEEVASTFQTDEVPRVGIFKEKDLEELDKPGLRREMKRRMNLFLVHKEQKHPQKHVLTTFLKTVIDCGSKFHIEPRHLSNFKACIQSLFA